MKAAKIHCFTGLRNMLIVRHSKPSETPTSSPVSDSLPSPTVYDPQASTDEAKESLVGAFAQAVRSAALTVFFSSLPS